MKLHYSKFSRDILLMCLVTLLTYGAPVHPKTIAAREAESIAQKEKENLAAMIEPPPSPPEHKTAVRKPATPLSAQKKSNVPPKISTEFSPTTGFPHGRGITHDVGGACTEADPRCPSGTHFASFNNFTDTIGGVGISDERRFLVGRNVTDQSGYSDSIPVSNNDVVGIRGFISNSGVNDRDEYDALNTILKMDGFYHVGSGHYVTQPKTSINLRQYISASNANPKKISDEVNIVSASESPIRIRFITNYDSISITRGGKYNYLDPALFFADGANIGKVKPIDMFYLYAYFHIEEVKYDLAIDKTVDTMKAVEKNIGDTVTYKIQFTSASTSNVEANNVKVIDDYDETKLDIMSIIPQADVPDLACTNDGGKIVCQLGRILAIGETLGFTYTAKVKATAVGSVDNTARVCAPYTNETNPNQWMIPNCIPYDTDKDNNTSSAKVTIKSP